MDTKTIDEIVKDYFYDNLYRLTASTNPAESFSYDNVGNRLTGEGYTDWTYDNNNRLLYYDYTNFTYDGNGNTISLP